MTEDNSVPTTEKRHLEVFAGSDDLLVRIFNISEASYECITVNSSWPEKGLIEGDAVLCVRGQIGTEGSIVLIEQDGRERLGLMATPGFVETPRGNRPLGADENIVGVAIALLRDLRKAQPQPL
jgi:hypothetical protein